MTESCADRAVIWPSNALATWAKRNEEPYEHVLERRAIALKLAIQCINDGTLDELDGERSPLSKRIKSHHGCRLLEMNRNWVETSQNWRCPCCHRSKFEISRLEGEKIAANLVKHTDLVRDAIHAALRKGFAPSDLNAVTARDPAIIDRLESAFSAYAPILVCEDCDDVDLAAKQLLSAARNSLEWHSFSIMQIRQFIKAAPHTRHQIDRPKLDALWSILSPAYDIRLNLIHQVVQAAASHDHWHESYSSEITPVPALSAGYHKHGGLDLVDAEALVREMRKDSAANEGSLARWRTEDQSVGRVPPDDFAGLLASSPGCARMWNELRCWWVCPICQRTKFEIVTWSKGELSFQTHRPTQSSPGWKGTLHICSACCTVVKAMTLELEQGYGIKVGSPFNSVTPDQLRSLLTPRPHSPPRVNRREAQKLLEVWRAKSSRGRQSG